MTRILLSFFPGVVLACLSSRDDNAKCQYEYLEIVLVLGQEDKE